MSLPQSLVRGLFIVSHVGVATAVAALAYAFGCRLTASVPWTSRGERAAVSTTIGLGALGQLLFLLGLLGWLRPLPVAAALLGVVALSWGAWRDRRARLPPPTQGVGPWQVALVVFPAVLPMLLLPLFPPMGSDATMYHLPYAKAFAVSGALPFLPDLRFPVFPQLNELLFAAALLLWDDLGAQLIEAVAALLTAGLLAAWAVPGGSRWAGGLAAAFWLGTPMVVKMSGQAYVDLGVTLFVTLTAYAFERWRSSGARVWLTVAAFAAGCAAASKYTGLFAVAWIVLLAAWDGRGGRLKAAAWAAAVAASTLGLWYLRIFWHTGNPVYPLFGDFFGNGEPGRLYGSAEAMLEAKGGLAAALASWIELPWTLMAGTRFSNSVWSPAILIGLPLATWIGLREPWGRRVGGAVVTYTLAFALLSFPDIRLLLPMAPLWFILTAAGVERLLGRLVPSARLRVQILAALAAAALLPGVWTGAGLLGRLGRLPVGAQEREAYLSARGGAYPALAHLNRVGGVRSSVYGLFSEGLAYYALGRYQGDWFGPAAYRTVLPLLGDPEALARRLRELKADHLLVRRTHHQLPLREDAAFARHFELLFADEGARLYRLIDAPPPAAGTGGL